MTATTELTDFCHWEADPLHRFLISIGARPDEAEDVLQNILVALWARQDTIEHLRGYAYTMAPRVLQRLRATQIEEPLPHDAFEALGQFPEDATATKDEIITLFKRLPGLQRHVIALTYDGFTPTEIADLLDKDPGTIRVTLHQARRKLRAWTDCPSLPDTA